MRTWTVSVGAGSRCEDRAKVIEGHGSLVAVVADGSGGMAGGAEAAELLIRMVEKGLPSDPASASAGDWVRLLGEADLAILDDPVAGETTAVIAAITPSAIAGASVGDSEAWLISDQGVLYLTSHQKRKPLLGSGVAIPSAFQADFSSPQVLLLATDGLIKYAPYDRIRPTALNPSLEDAAARLLKLATLPRGGLQDDVTFILCRRD
jgi:PPM family protein phosphatase